MYKTKIKISLVASFCFLATTATAAEFKATSVRALGMGGSSVASTHGVDASYWNPAAYGFFGEDDSGSEIKAADNNGMSDKDFGIDLGVGVGAYFFGPVAENLNILQNLTIPAGTTSTGLSATEIVNFANFTNDFRRINPDAQGINVALDATIGARVSNYGIGIRSSADVNVSVSIDNANVGLGADFITALTGTPVYIPAV